MKWLADDTEKDDENYQRDTEKGDTMTACLCTNTKRKARQAESEKEVYGKCLSMTMIDIE